MERHERLLLQVLFNNKDILLTIFGHTNIEDAHSLILVCKRWNQVTKDNVFWRSLLIKKIPKDFSDKKELFDLKNHDKDREWIFDVLDCVYIDYKETPFYYSSYNIKCGCHTFYYNDKNQFIAIVKEFPSSERILYMQNKWFDIKKIDNRQPNRRSDIIYENENGICWDGESKSYEFEYYQLVPHGKGTWTFPDGSKFIGDNVAVDGIPHGVGKNQNNETVTYFFGSKITSDEERSNKRPKIEF